MEDEGDSGRGSDVTRGRACACCRRNQEPGDNLDDMLRRRKVCTLFHLEWREFTNKYIHDVHYQAPKGHSGCGLSQWETTLHCNVISHWLSPYPEWSPQSICNPGVNTKRHGQNERHFAHRSFKCSLLNETVLFWFKICLEGFDWMQVSIG